MKGSDIERKWEEKPGGGCAQAIISFTAGIVIHPAVKDARPHIYVL